MTNFNIFLALTFIFTSFTSLNNSLGITNTNLLITEFLVRYYTLFYCSYIYLAQLFIKVFIDAKQNTNEISRMYILSTSNHLLGLITLPSVASNYDIMILFFPLILMNYFILLLNFFECESTVERVCNFDDYIDNYLNDEIETNEDNKINDDNLKKMEKNFEVMNKIENDLEEIEENIEEIYDNVKIEDNYFDKKNK